MAILSKMSTPANWKAYENSTNVSQLTFSIINAILFGIDWKSSLSAESIDGVKEWGNWATCHDNQNSLRISKWRSNSKHWWINQ